MDKLSILKEYFGHKSFRRSQESLIDHILIGRDVLGIMPTGAGKSVCYQVPALMMKGITYRYFSAHITDEGSGQRINIFRHKCCLHKQLFDSGGLR